MALAMHGAEVEELIAECIALFVLCENILQGKGKFAEAGGFGPGTLVLILAGKFEIGEKTAATVSALFKTGKELIGESGAQQFELIGSELVARIHLSYFFIAASTSSAVWGRSASRSSSFPSGSTRKSHSMRTPIFSSGMYTPGSMVKTMPGFSTAGYCAGS